MSGCNPKKYFSIGSKCILPQTDGHPVAAQQMLDLIDQGNNLRGKRLTILLNLVFAVFVFVPWASHKA